MKRYIIQDNQIKDTKKKQIIATFAIHDLSLIAELVLRANRGEQEMIDDAAWIKEQKEVYDKGGHVGGMSDW